MRFRSNWRTEELNTVASFANCNHCHQMQTRHCKHRNLRNGWESGTGYNPVDNPVDNHNVLRAESMTFRDPASKCISNEHNSISTQLDARRWISTRSRWTSYYSQFMNWLQSEWVCFFEKRPQEHTEHDDLLVDDFGFGGQAVEWGDQRNSLKGVNSNHQNAG